MRDKVGEGDLASGGDRQYRMAAQAAVSSGASSLSVVSFSLSGTASSE
jgi:hypothetical protein